MNEGDNADRHDSLQTPLVKDCSPDFLTYLLQNWTDSIPETGIFRQLVSGCHFARTYRCPLKDQNNTL
jgi:hypothetical protein